MDRYQADTIWLSFGPNETNAINGKFGVNPEYSTQEGQVAYVLVYVREDVMDAVFDATTNVDTLLTN